MKTSKPIQAQQRPYTAPTLTKGPALSRITAVASKVSGYQRDM